MHRGADGRAPPDSQSCHYLYIDNLGILGSSQGSVDAASDDKSALRKAGLVVHQGDYTSSDTLVMGWVFDKPAIFRPARRCVWRARLVVREGLRISRIIGKLLERLIGHMCLVFQWLREILAVPGSVSFFHSLTYGRRFAGNIFVGMPWRRLFGRICHYLRVKRSML